MCLFVIRSTRRAEGSGYELQNGSSAGRDLHRVDHRVMRSEDMLQRMSRDLVGDVFKAVGCLPCPTALSIVGLRQSRRFDAGTRRFARPPTLI